MIETGEKMLNNPMEKPNKRDTVKSPPAPRFSASNKNRRTAPSGAHPRAPNTPLAPASAQPNQHPTSNIQHPGCGKAAAGFTLIEILISIIILGVLTLVYKQNTDGAFTAQTLAHDEKQSALNNRLGSILLDYAATTDTTGQLPTPYTSGTTRFAIYDPANTALQTLLTEARIRPADANDDGTAMAKVRAYQRVTGLTTNVPLYGVSGPAVTLSYQEAVIVATNCERTATCNTVGTGGIPGDSNTFTSANLGTYALTGTDYGLARISTLSLQKQKLRHTVENLDAIRTRMQEIFRERQRQAAANDTTNFYPLQLVVVAATAVGTTTDCHGNWYRLDNSDILSQIGLVNSVNGLNAWSGQIHYCPDFDPTGLAAANTPPHFAAIRILASPSNGGNPNTADNTGNIVIPF